MSPLFVLPCCPPGCHVLTINAGRPPGHQRPLVPRLSPGAHYHSRKLEFSGILDKVHTGAPDLTLDKQCGAMITTLLSTSQTLSSTRKENYKLEKEGLVRVLHSEDIFQIKFALYGLCAMISNFAETDKSKIS